MNPSRKVKYSSTQALSGSSTNLSNSSLNLNNSIGKPTKTTKPTQIKEKHGRKF
jgi:hypothetical protein